MAYLYDNYFAKDKPLRHYTQHLIVAASAFFLLTSIFNLQITGGNVLLFFIFSFIVDLDGAISIFTTQRMRPEVKEIKKALNVLDFKKAATLATTHHKLFDKLVLHNVIGLMVFTLLFGYFVIIKSTLGILAIGAIYAHFAFDIFDDIYQLGHINNWLWPITVLRKRHF